MNYHLSEQLALNTAQCLVVGLFEDAPFSDEVSALDKTLGNLISRLHTQLKKPGQMKVQSDIEGHALVLVHCGKKKDYCASRFEKHLKSAVQYAVSQHFDSVQFALPCFDSAHKDAQLRYTVQLVDAALYLQPQLKKTAPSQAELKNVYLYAPGAAHSALTEGSAIASSIQVTRALADLPANHCTPTLFSQTVLTHTKTIKNLECKVKNKKEIEKLKMGGLLAVSQGSAEPPCFIEMHYKGSDASVAPIVLVGKGVTFDAGGISLKPPAGMNEMKYDMAGAASVVGTLLACAKLQLKLNVVGLMPCTENLPSGTAVKPGDVITMMSGHTVEVNNTDAEGRLILADALTYAERLKPACVLDVATLTGAVIIALGHVTSGYMTHDETIASRIEAASKSAYDKAWRLPLETEFEEGLKSPVADFSNIASDRGAGSILGGMFLSQFATDYPWAHIDIAGTAWTPGAKRVSTGRPVPLLLEFLRHASQTR